MGLRCTILSLSRAILSLLALFGCRLHVVPAAIVVLLPASTLLLAIDVAVATGVYITLTVAANDSAALWSCSADGASLIGLRDACRCPCPVVRYPRRGCPLISTRNSC